MNLLLALLLLISPWQSTPVDPNLQRGLELLNEGKAAEAEAPLRAAATAAASNPRAWSLLGRSLHAQKKWPEALVVYEKLTSFPRYAATGHYNSACVFALQDRKEEAFASLELAVAAGFQDHYLLATNTELDNLRADPRLTTLLPPFLEGPEAFVERPRVLHTFVGEAAGDEFGWVARSLGDLDGDGVLDFASTAPGKTLGGPHAGRVYVYSSRAGKLLYSVDGKPGWRLGSCVAGRVDVDGDGDLDVLIGAPSHGDNPGRVRVVDGRDGELLYELMVGEAGDQFGLMTGGIEDLDGDGCAEIAVGAPKADANGADSGCVYVYSGKSGELLYRIAGDRAGDQFGSAIDATLVGGHRLLGVGAMGSPGGGRAIAFHCSGERAERAFDIEPDATSSNLGQYFVTLLGDVDGDGTPDLFASDWSNTALGKNTGRVFVHSGKSGERLLTLSGHRLGEGFGTSGSYCGDVNADGRADLVVGAWQNATAAVSAGAVYLYSGADGALLAQWTSTQAGDTLGFDAVGLGDVDGDGAHDFLLTSAWSAARGAKTGRVWIVAGPQLTPAAAADDK
jgi:hypothetical protein